MQALALKYRPKNYEELVGQKSVAISLSHALDSGRLGHAYLFSGLRGSGKTSSARIFAKALLCDKGPISKPCEECENCKMANLGSHIDIIEMDAASNRKIDDIRELIEQTKYAPATARFKIFIIDEVHMLTKEAFNALLKTLEEPPSYVKFILATTDPLKLPATVLSRTQHFRFKPIAKSEIKKHLEFIMKKENLAYEDGALEILSRSGSGSLRDTLTLLDQAIIYSKENVSVSAVSEMLGLLDPNKIDEILKVINSQDRQAVIEIINELESYDAKSVIDEIICVLKDSFLNKDGKFSILMYERFFRILAKSKEMLNISDDNSFVLMMCFFMMMEAVNFKNIDEILNSKGLLSVKNEQNLQNKEIFKEFLNSPIEKTDSDNNEFKNEKMDIKKEGLKENFVQENVAKDIQKDEILENKNDEDLHTASKNSEVYDEFLKEIYDRDYELGQCFDDCIEFVDFKDNVLILRSFASGKNKELLRLSSKVIMQILRRVANQNTSIKIEQGQTKEKDTQDNENNKILNSKEDNDGSKINNNLEQDKQNSQENNFLEDSKTHEFEKIDEKFQNDDKKKDEFLDKSENKDDFLSEFRANFSSVETSSEDKKQGLLKQLDDLFGPHE